MIRALRSSFFRFFSTGLFHLRFFSPPLGVLLQFFSSNKLLALIITLLIIPALIVSTQLMESKLNEPYRLYQYEEDENGEQKVTGWTVNPNYIGGTPERY